MPARRHQVSCSFRQGCLAPRGWGGGMEGRGSGSMLRLVVVGARGRGRQSAKCIESSDRFGLQGRRRTRGVPAGCACNLSSEDRLWALKPALACCVPLHGTYPCWIKPVRRHLGLVLSSFSLHRVGAAVARGGRDTVLRLVVVDVRFAARSAVSHVCCKQRWKLNAWSAVRAWCAAGPASS